MHTPTVSCSTDTLWPPDTLAACVKIGRRLRSWRCWCLLPGRRLSQELYRRLFVGPLPHCQQLLPVYQHGSRRLLSADTMWGNVLTPLTSRWMAVSPCKFTPRQLSCSSGVCRLAQWVVSSFVLKVMHEWGGRGEQSQRTVPVQVDWRFTAAQPYLSQTCEATWGLCI